MTPPIPQGDIHDRRKYAGYEKRRAEELT